MSKEALHRFMKKAAEDLELQSKLVEFAAKQGFEFTADELSEADLENISGGPSRRVEDFIAAEQSAKQVEPIDPKFP
jgi:hypothetical protein